MCVYISRVYYLYGMPLPAFAPACKAFQEKMEKFAVWLLRMEEKVSERQKAKRPIGTIGTELEDHYVCS